MSKNKNTSRSKKRRPLARPTPRKPRLLPLPKTWRGATVMRGRPMNAEKLHDFLDKKACDAFSPLRSQWLVIEDRALEEDRGSTEVHVFNSKSDAVQCARALSNGNIDHRVIGLGEQILVVATMNSL